MNGKRLERYYDENGNLVGKECSCCHEIKPPEEFYNDKNDKDGVTRKCIVCQKYYDKHKKEIRKKKKQKENQKAWREKNKDKVKQNSKEYYEKNKDKHRDYYKQYRKDNQDKMREYDKQIYDKKVEQSLEEIRQYVEKDPEKYNYIEGQKIFGVIYLVHNINSDKYYVGQTQNGFDIRYNKGWLYEHSFKEEVCEDLELYGKDSFEYTKVFKIAHNQEELDKLEAYYINYFDSYENGYNGNRGNIFTNRGVENEKIS